MSGVRYSRYEDALIAQQRLLEWSQTRIGLQYLYGFFDDLNSKHSAAAQRDPVQLARIQIEMLRQAEPVYVAPEALELVDHARVTWKPEPVLGSDPFVPFGFALFPRPILLDDMPPTEQSPMRAPVPAGPLGSLSGLPGPNGKPMNGYIPVRAMSWLTLMSEDASMGTFWLAFYTNVDDEFELADEIGAKTRWDDPPPGYADISRDEARRVFPGLSLVHMWQWSWGSDGGHEFADWDDPARYDVLPEDSAEQMMERARQQTSLVQTFWRIASQFLRAPHPLPRAIRRDAARHGLDHREVTIITLRRYSEHPDQDTEPTGRHYHVSFLVRGYWGTRHTRNGPRQTWVRPHLKGDGPFQETDRGWEFTR